MKKKLFLLIPFSCLCTLMYAKTTPEAVSTMAPPPPPPYHGIDSLVKVNYSDCITMVKIYLHSSVQFNAEITVEVDTWPFDGITQPVSLPPIQQYFLMPATNLTFTSINLSPSNPALYHITVTDLDNGGTPQTMSVTLNPKKCYYDKYHFFNSPTPADLVTDAMFIPEDPNEDPDLEVQWKIDGIDQNFTPSFSVYNTTCWNDVNQGGKSCTFKGFDGSNTAASIAELAAGNCSSDDGTFDMSQLYLITRSYRMPGDDWESYSIFIGPGTDEPAEPEDKLLTGPSVQANLFQLAQDRTAQTVSFNTTVDNGRFEILDASGKQIAAIDLLSETHAYTLDVATFAKGLYVVRLVSGSQAGTEKFVVE